ncbi:MAG: hypothetical protein RBS32_03250 [Aliarcobacter sp.]|jgi:hypothetical protein|nr:hypothetical protein [Aliarcobacter sp.]
MNKHFTRNEIINNLAKYELYYQVTLGNLISLTNTKEIDYEVEFQLALGSIYELLKDLKTLDDKSISFDDELRKQAAMDSVQNFANVNLEILKSGEIKIEKIVNHINDGLFFNEAMKVICDENLDEQVKKWEKTITEDLAKAILASILELEKENE